MKGATWLAMSRLVLNALSLVSTLVLARLLVPADFGIVAIATAALEFVVALTELSLSAALIQRRYLQRSHVDTAWTMAVIRSLVVLAVFTALAVPLSHAYGDDRLIPVFIVTGLTAATIDLLNPRVSLRMKMMDFRPQFTCQIIKRTVTVIVSITLAILFRSYWAMILGSAAGAVMTVIISYILWPYIPRFTLSRARDLLGFSSWLFAEQVMNVLNWRFDQLLSGLVLSKRELGLFSLAINLSVMPSREITAPLVQALFPGFSNVTDSPARLARGYMTAQRAIGMVTIPAGVGFALAAQPFVALALGSKWAVAVPIIQVLACSFAFQTLTIGLRSLAMAMGHTRLLFFREAISFAVRLACVLAGVLLAGLTGLVWARAISAVLGVMIALDMVRRLLGFGIVAQMAAHFRTFVGAITMVAVVMAAMRLLGQGEGTAHYALQLCVTIVAGAVAYIATVGALWIAAGRPGGAERELLNAVSGVLGIFRRRVVKPA
ncbi:lipopolysaccharide biosynthesis protein [Stakelama sediminis]|uniref:lipopolysaccharide biosynthesis protein n=1 Tax=Stakelama sediminis TaxID=463200 RepID=UPI0024838ED0|nr:lipopolysaccharide biosynthesis protein [Stakelama sediminis]